jgi:hypothetical protein
MLLEYVYFVKCPGCEDDRYESFAEAKNCAMSCLSKKPVITQVEICRNDFGECTDSSDLGTIWSWENEMQDVPADNELTTFSKSETFCGDDYFNCEFDELDNVPDNFRKPVPADMTIDQLVEEMEENEDTVECKNCLALFDKSECKHDKGYGWLCRGCQTAVIHHGADLTVGADPLTESSNSETVWLDYEDLRATVYGKKRAADDWDEYDHVGSFSYKVAKSYVMDVLAEDIITDEDLPEGGWDSFETSEEIDAYFDANFDKMLDKYYDQVLEYFREDAEEAFTEAIALNPDAYLYTYNNYLADEADNAWHDRFFNENLVSDDQPTAKELYTTRLTACPECGIDEAFDHVSGFCTCCGHSVKESCKKRSLKEDTSQDYYFEDSKKGMEYLSFQYRGLEIEADYGCDPDSGWATDSCACTLPYYMYDITLDDIITALKKNNLITDEDPDLVVPVDANNDAVYSKVYDLVEQHKVFLFDYFEDSAREDAQYYQDKIWDIYPEWHPMYMDDEV